MLCKILLTEIMITNFLFRLIHRLPAKRAGDNNFSKRPLLYTVTDVDEKVYIKANNGISYNHKQLEVIFINILITHNLFYYWAI